MIWGGGQFSPASSRQIEEEIHQWNAVHLNNLTREQTREADAVESFDTHLWWLT